MQLREVANPKFAGWASRLGNPVGVDAAVLSAGSLETEFLLSWKTSVF